MANQTSLTNTDAFITETVHPSQVEIGMRILTPAFIADIATSQTLLVVVWEWEEGECDLRGPTAEDSFDPCIADLGEEILVLV